MAKKFRLPSEIQTEKSKRVPVTTRLNESTKLKLEKAANRPKDPIALANLIEAILEDYVVYLEEKGEI